MSIKVCEHLIDNAINPARSGSLGITSYSSSVKHPFKKDYKKPPLIPLYDVYTVNEINPRLENLEENIKSNTENIANSLSKLLDNINTLKTEIKKDKEFLNIIINSLKGDKEFMDKIKKMIVVEIKEEISNQI